MNIKLLIRIIAAAGIICCGGVEASIPANSESDRNLPLSSGNPIIQNDDEGEDFIYRIGMAELNKPNKPKVNRSLPFLSIKGTKCRCAVQLATPIIQSNKEGDEFIEKVMTNIKNVDPAIIPNIINEYDFMQDEMLRDFDMPLRSLNAGVLMVLLDKLREIYGQ